MNKKEKEIFIRAFQARRILFLHGFLSEAENEKVKQRLEKYQDKHKIEVTEKQLNKP